MLVYVAFYMLIKFTIWLGQLTSHFWGSLWLLQGWLSFVSLSFSLCVQSWLLWPSTFLSAVFCSICNFGSNDPWSAIFPLHCYGWFCRYKIYFCKYLSLHLVSFAWISTVRLLSILLHSMGGLLNLGTLLFHLLNRIVAWLCNLGLVFMSYVFIIVLLTNFMLASTCAFLWWLYDSDTEWSAWCISRLFWNFSNFFDAKSHIKLLY